MSKFTVSEWDDDAEDYEEVFDAKREAEFWKEEDRRSAELLQKLREAGKIPASDDASS